MRRSGFTPFALTCCWILAALVDTSRASASEVLVPAGQRQIGNGRVFLGYRLDPTYGLVLSCAGDAAEREAFFFDETDLWTVELRDPITKTVLGDVGPSSTRFQFDFNSTASSFRATWKRVRVAALPAGETFDVTVRATAGPSDRAVELEIDVDASATTRSLYAVVFPRILFRERGESRDGVLTYPYVGGWLLPDPMHNGLLGAGSGEFLVHPGFLSMQYFSYYDGAEEDAANLYLATRDPAGHLKEFGAEPIDHPSGPDALRLRLRNIPENNLVAQSYGSPFAFALGVLRGDWYVATRFYREWALRQSWTTKGPMHRNADFSDIIGSAQMFAVSGVQQCCPGTSGTDPCPCNWDHASFQHWPRNLEEQQTFFRVTGMPTHLYNWDQNAFDGNWGEWFPIQNDFQAVAPLVAARGDDFAPYFMPLLYSTTAPGYRSSFVPEHLGECVEDYAIWDEDGEVVQSQQTNCFRNLGCLVPGEQRTTTVTHLDLASAFASNFTRHIARETAALGAKGLYLDVFSNAPSEVTYNPNLGHPVGGGSYYTQGKIRLVQELRDYMRYTLGIDEYFVYAESNNEMYVGVTELAYAHATGLSADLDGGVPLMRLAPLFETVYHDHQITGTVAAVTYPRSFYTDPDATRELRRHYAAALFMGHAPWAGSVLSSETLASLMASFPDYADWVIMIQQYMSILKQDLVRTFVTFGQRLRDPVTSVARADLPLPAFAPYRADQPLVYTAVWGRPDLDAAGVLLMNWTGPDDSRALGVTAGDQAFSYTIDPEQHGLSPGTYLMSEVTATGLVSLGSIDLSQPQTFNLTVPARSLRFFFFD